MKIRTISFFPTGEMNIVKICKSEWASLSLPEQGIRIWEAQEPKYHQRSTQDLGLALYPLLPGGTCQPIWPGSVIWLQDVTRPASE